jgi:hypothetical protein
LWTRSTFLRFLVFLQSIITFRTARWVR